MTSRIAKQPIAIPSGVEIKLANNNASIKGAKGTIEQPLPEGVDVVVEDNNILVKATSEEKSAKALSGTIRSILNNHVVGVSNGYTKKLILVGVGYRAAAKQEGKLSKVALTLGLSHPVEYVAPEGISLATPSATEIEVTGICKQNVGQVAADIRSIQGGVRKPEPYKGKGIRYADERIITKEGKKK